MNEETAPTRAEIEALLWAYQGDSVDGIKSRLTSFLNERGLNEREISQTLDDLPSYKGWSYYVEEEEEEEEAIEDA